MYAVLLAGVPSYRRDLGAAAIDGTSWVGRKLDAMRAHATQIAEDGPFFAASRLLGESQWSKRRTCSPPECRSRTPTAGHASGVAIATALRGGIKYAMTATAVSSVSLDPPLILVCVSKTSRFHSAIMEVDTWAIGLPVLDLDQSVVEPAGRVVRVDQLLRRTPTLGRALLEQVGRVTVPMSRLRIPDSG